MSDPPPPRPPRRYSDEETREILRRAIERQHAESDQTAHDDLLAAAREVGIDPDHLDRAANEVVAERDVARSSMTHAPAARSDDVVDVYRRESKQSLLYRAAITIVVVAALAAVDYLTGDGWWVQWVALVGFVLLAIRGARLLRPAADIRRDLERQDRRARRKQERAEQHAQRRHERRKKAERHAAERQARRQRKSEHADTRSETRSRSRGRDFERTVEEGVTSLLAEHTRRMKRMTKRAIDERANVPLVQAADDANAAIAGAAMELNERIARAVSGQPNDAPKVRVGDVPDAPEAEPADAEADAEAEIETTRERPRSK